MATKRALLSYRNRKHNLKEIERYHKLVVMYYRTNNLIHTQRVAALVKAIRPFIEDIIDIDYVLANLEAIHHDNHEIILEGGDIPLQTKLMMGKEELSDLKQKEFFAIETQIKHYPKMIEGYRYSDIAKACLYKNTPESQLVSFLDKIDGLCEALHELLAGNLVFIEPVINYYNRTFNNLREKYPLIKDIFDIRDVWFDFSYVVDSREFFQAGLLTAKPYTLESLKRKIDIPYYEKWKEVTIKEFGVKVLIKQTEFRKI